MFAIYKTIPLIGMFTNQCCLFGKEERWQNKTIHLHHNAAEHGLGQTKYGQHAPMHKFIF